jgi:hypothetical protein
MGLGQTEHFQRYHRLLNRAVWSGREASRVLLGLLVRTFVASGPLVIGVDETLERRFGPKIAYTRDLPRPGALHPGALRKDEWSQVGVPDALGARAMGETRMWALPFLSVLAPSERYAAQRGKRHKKISDWARQALLLLRRWHPKREIVAVADSAYASLQLLASCRRFLPKSR